MASPLENGDKTQIVPEDSKMEDRTSKIIVVVVGITCAVSIVALILAFVGVARSGTNQYYINSDGSSSGGSSHASGDDKIWMLQIGHFGANTQYLDEATGTIRGYDVDVTNAVCQIANKNCRIVWDLYERCWDHQAGQRARGGEGLMGSSFYDACVGWYNTLDRSRTYMFSKPMEKAYPVAFFTKAGVSFTWPQFSGRTVGFLDGWWIDETCLDRYNPTGFDRNDVNQVIHYPSEEAAANALISGEIQVAFLPAVAFLRDHAGLNQAYTPTEDLCANGGPGVMMPQDQTELLCWWNDAFDQLIRTDQYTKICNDLNNAHGNQPGDQPEDICVL